MNNPSMAFGDIRTAQNVDSNVTPFNNRRGNKPQPNAYINFYLTRADGTETKIDTGLRLVFSDKDPGQKQLAEILQTEEGKRWFLQNVDVRCVIVSDKPKAAFDFT